MHCQASSSSGPLSVVPALGLPSSIERIGNGRASSARPTAANCDPARPYADGQNHSDRSYGLLVDPLRWTQSGKSSRLANEPAGAPRGAAAAAAPCTARAGSASPAAADCAASATPAASASGDCAPSDSCAPCGGATTSAAPLGVLLANHLKVFSVESEERSEVDVGDFLISQIDLRTQHVIR